MKRFCDGVEAALRVLLCALVTAMTLTVVWQVLSRFLSQISLRLGLPLIIEPSRWTEEMASFQLGWLALLGAVYALRKYEHLGFDYIYLKMSARGRVWTDRLVHSLIAAFALVVLGYGGSRLVFMTYQLQQMTPALQWPMSVIYLVIPLSGLLMALFAIESLVREEQAEGEEARR